MRWASLVNTWAGRVAGEGGPVIPADLIDHVDDGAFADVGVYHCLPDAWGRLIDELPADRLVGHTVWETDELPRRWRVELAPVDEIWVPCQWNAETFRAAGIPQPIHVIPHVTSNVQPTPVDLAIPSDHTVFLALVAWDTRKAPDLTIEAFLRAFDADDPVTLVVKTTRMISSWWTTSAIERNTWWQVMDVVKRHRSPAAVILHTDELTDQEVAGLIHRCDCFLSLTRAEGWGLGAFDAATLGKPVIMTGHGGQLDFLGTDHPGLVPFTMVTANHPNQSLFDERMTWAEPNLDAAVELLREAFHGDRLQRDAAARAPGIQARFSAEAVGAIMLDALS